jgi:HlyD family secretion protein
MNDPLHDSKATGVDQLLLLIVERVTRILNAQRTTLYLFDHATNELWSKALQGDNVSEIRIPATDGIAGSVFQTGETVNVSDAYNDPRFDTSWDTRTGFHTMSILCMPLVDNRGARIGVTQVLNKAGGPFTAQDEMLLEAFSSQAAVTLENAIVHEELKGRHEAELKLEEELMKKHKSLQEAFREIEAKQTSLEAALRKIRLIRLISVGLVVVLFAGIGIFLWTENLGAEEPESSDRPRTSGSVPTIRLQEQMASSTLSLSGSLEPITVVNIVSPFTGKVKERLFEYGQAVHKGQKLVVLDTTEFDAGMRQAEADFIKARDTAQNLDHWESSDEVADVRRSLTKATNALKSLEQKMRETKLLLERGIVSGSEYQSLEEQYTTQKLDLEAVQAQYAATMARGSPENVRLGDLSFKAISDRLDEMRAQVANATLVSPVDGVVLNPVDPEKEGARVDRGSAVTEGGLLVAIGDLSGFTVRSKVDEVDVEKLRIGQPVEVTGTAFAGVTLSGSLSYIASQANAGDMGIANFPVVVAVPNVPVADRAKALLGMSADLLVQIYSNPKALLAPISAVEVAGPSRWIFVMRPGSAKPERVPVTTGVTTVDSVEILSGAKAGDEICQFVPPPQ